MHQSSTVWTSKLVYGSLNYCLNQRGVDLITQGKVIRMEDSKNFILENGRVIIARQAVVHATNAYAVEYLDSVRGKIIPTRGECSHSKPIETIFWPFGLSPRDGMGYCYQSLSDSRWRSRHTEHNNQNDSEMNESIK